MQTEEKKEVSIAQTPFRPADDPTADFVLQTSDGVRFWLCKAVIARASSIFRDLFSVPHPPQDPAAVSDEPDSDYIDNKPVVRVLENAAVVDAFVRCCYPLPRPALDATLLGSLYAASEKYDSDAVRAYARQEVARYAVHKDHCFRTYLVAYRFGMTEEMHLAARQTIHMRREDFARQVLPEHHLVPATALAQLEDYRTRCVHAVWELCTVEGCLELYQRERAPMWDYATRVSPRTYRLADPECTCNLADLVYIGPRTDDPHPGEVQLSDYWDPEAPYLAKSWFTRYLWDLRDAIGKDDKPMRQALLDSEAMGRAVKAANRCNVCGKDAAKGLTELLGKLEAMVDACISNVPFDGTSRQTRQTQYRAVDSYNIVPH